MSDTGQAYTTGVVGFGATVTLGMGTAVFMLFAVGALGPFITNDLGIGRAAFGAITTTMFASAALLSPKAGALVDSVGARRMLGALFILVAGALGLVALSAAFGILLVSAGLAGLAVAVANPATNQLISLQTPPTSQGTVMGIAYSGTQFSALFAGMALPAMALVLGWRGAMVASAALPMLGLVVMRFTVPMDKRHLLAGSSVQRRSARYPGIGWMSLYAFLMASAVTGVPAYLALFAVESLDMTATGGGAAVSVLGLSGIFGRVWWSRITHRAVNPAVPMTGLAMCAVVAQTGLWIAAVGGSRAAWMLWPASALFGLTAIAWMPVAMVAVVAAAPPAIAGRAAGIVQSATFVGAAISPLLIGMMAELQGGYNGAWLAVAGSFALAALIAGMQTRTRSSPTRIT
jgi:predicted MFS family arabinose efflux permease